MHLPLSQAPRTRWGIRHTGSALLCLSGETDHNRVLRDIGWTLLLLKLVAGPRTKEKGALIPHTLKQRGNNLGLDTPAYRIY